MNFELPEKGKEVSLENIKKICGHYSLNDLWRKIEKNPPHKKFRCDGCSMWFDSCCGVSFYPACFIHDLKYWAGYPGECEERLTADREFKNDLIGLGCCWCLAKLMYWSVRIFFNFPI